MLERWRSVSEGCTNQQCFKAQCNEWNLTGIELRWSILRMTLPSKFLPNLCEFVVEIQTWGDTDAWCKITSLGKLAVTLENKFSYKRTKTSDVTAINLVFLCRMWPGESYKNTICMQLTLKVLNFWKFTSYGSLKPLWSGMGKVVPARTSPTQHPPSPPTVHQLSLPAL